MADGFTQNPATGHETDVSYAMSRAQDLADRLFRDVPSASVPAPRAPSGSSRWQEITQSDPGTPTSRWQEITQSDPGVPTSRWQEITQGEVGLGSSRWQDISQDDIGAPSSRLNPAQKQTTSSRWQEITQGDTLDASRQESEAIVLTSMDLAQSAGDAIVRDSAQKAKTIADQAEAFVKELLDKARQEAAAAHEQAIIRTRNVPKQIGEYEQQAYLRIIKYKEDTDAELEAMKRTLEEDDHSRRVKLDTEVETVWRTVEEMIQRLWDSVHQEVDATRDAIEAERLKAEADVAALRHLAESDYQEAIASGRRQAQQQLDHAASQVVAAEKSIQAMVDEARSEADRIRRDADSEALALAAETKLSLAQLADQARSEADQRVTAARQERESILMQARTDAHDIRTAAEERIARQEEEATAARARALAAMDNLRREAAEHAGRSRQEAVDTVAQARQDAEDIRNEVREYMERARAEVASLERRRNNISAQLGQLSGVIEALAVPETPARV